MTILNSDRVVDAVIVGGGVIGTSCAEALSREGWQVALLERFGLAAGASSACQSGVGYGPFSDDYDLRLDFAAMSAYQDRVATGLAVDYERGGALLVCGPEEEGVVKGRLDHLRALGFTCHWLDQVALRELEPNISPDIVGAALLNDVGQVSPMRVVVEMARQASERGALIYVDTELVGIEQAHGKVIAALTNRGRLVTETVIFASGAWSRQIGKFVGLRIPVWPLKGHVLVTEPMKGILGHYSTEAGYETGVAATLQMEIGDDGPSGRPQVATVLQPLPSGQILIGSSREFVGLDREVNRERLSQIAQRACRVVPKLAGLRIIRTYAGLRPWTPDGRPLIGPTQQAEGVVLATGHAGEGNTRALLTGRLIADLLTGRKSPIDPAPLSPDRFVMN